MFIAKPKGAFLKGLTCLSLLLGILASSQAAAQAFPPPAMCPEVGECVARAPIDLGEVPYDLSPYETEIAASLGTHTWPTAPSLRSGPTSVADCSSLRNSLGVSGRHTVVESGVTIGGCGSLTVSSDSWLELRGTATINATILAGSNDRVKITGGRINAGSTASMHGTDVLVQNVVWSWTGGSLFQSDSAAQRHAYVNNTINSGRYFLILSPHSGDRRDFSIIANDVLCAQFEDEACIRIQSGTRTLIAANRVQNYIDNKEPVRFYAGNTNSLVIDNVFEGNGASAVTIYSTGAQVGNINNIHVINNRHMHAGTDETIFETMVGNPGGGTCSGLRIAGNQRISSNNPEWRIGGAGGCTSITSTPANTNVDLDDPPYNGTIPTCSSLGCGADH